MTRTIELILILSKILSGLASWVLVGVMILDSWFIYDRLDKPNFLKRMRTLCKAYHIFVILLIILRVIQVAGLFFETCHYTQPSTFDIIFDWAFAIFFVWFYLKYCRYYLKNRDDNSIFAGWHMKKYFAIKKNKDNIEQAYEYLHKASEYKSDSVFIWSMMAMINERCFDKSDLADEHLEKARHTFNVSDNPSIKDKAVLEAATGDILLCRDNIDDGLAHLKNASDLDPPTYQERYEKALKRANEDEESEDS